MVRPVHFRTNNFSFYFRKRYLCLQMIRKATTQDIPAIQSIAEISFRQTYKDILSPAQTDYMMEWMYSEESLGRQMEEEGHIFYIDDDSRGYASVRYDGQTEDGRKRFHLEKLYVLPQWRGAGLGRALFDRIASESREAAGGKPLRIELNVNRANPAVGFYEHIGMWKDREGDFPIGRGFYMNDYIMAIDL